MVSLCTIQYGAKLNQVYLRFRPKPSGCEYLFFCKVTSPSLPCGSGSETTCKFLPAFCGQLDPGLRVAPFLWVADLQV